MQYYKGESSDQAWKKRGYTKLMHWHMAAVSAYLTIVLTLTHPMYGHRYGQYADALTSVPGKTGLVNVT